MNSLFSAVPADGVKGKTWGPSSILQKERGKIITRVTDSSKPWSKSAPNLDKSQKGSTSSGSGHTMQELGEYNKGVVDSPF
jgi:mitogen-activated protein kinase kinase kinase 9